MRNTCALPDDEDAGDSPLPSTTSSLALHIDYEGACAGAAISNDLARSLRLESLINTYLESPSHPSHASSFLYPFSTYSPFSRSTASYEDHKSLLHELQASFQNVGENYGELRQEVMKAMREGNARTAGAPTTHLSSELLQVYLVFEHLRKLGFNAGICKSQRDPQKISVKSHFPAAEEYEYMDVIIVQEKGTQGRASERVIIDLRFRSQFEIARPSTAYVDLLKVVPAAYVGSPRMLHKVLRFLSEAMKMSLESQGMPLPPWRRLSYLNSKWLSPLYSRSISPPRLMKLNHTINKASTKRERHLFNTQKAPSLIPPKRESFHRIGDNSPTCGVAKPLLSLVDSKRVLKSCNSTSYMPRSSANKPSSIQNGEPKKVPWELPPLSYPPTALKKPKKLVGALAMALHNAPYASIS